MIQKSMNLSIVYFLYPRESITPLSTEEINAVTPPTFAPFYERRLNGVKDEVGNVFARLYPSDTFLFSSKTSSGETHISIINSGTSKSKILLFQGMKSIKKRLF